MADEKGNGKYPPVLDGAGCLFGQRLEKALEKETVERHTQMEKLEKKLDRITWALVSLAVSLASATIVLLMTWLAK